MQEKRIPKKSNLSAALAFILLVAASCGCISYTDDSLSGTPEIVPHEDADAASLNNTLQGEDQIPYSKEAEQEIYPEIVPGAISGEEYSEKSFTTRFERSEYTATIDVNMSVLAGARAADKSLGSHIASEPEKTQIEFYRSFFEGDANGDFFDEISKKLRHIKLAEGLSDEEYLEFLVTFVQQIPYDPYAPDTRFPVEVIYDQKGDCDEKSMLLIGLLERSGYDVALLLFPGMGHATAGIRIIPEGDTDFRMYRSDDGRKYLYVESTAPTYIGLYPDEYENAEAVVVPVGKGGTAYKNYNYVSYIVDSKKKIEDRIIFFENRLIEWYEEIKSLEEKLNNPQKYYSEQSEYNSDYISYQSLVKDYNEYYEIYQKNIEVYNYIKEHPYDVEGVRRHIENSKVNEMEY